MTASGSGSCSATATRTLVIEIKHEIFAQPDPKVNGNSQQKTGTTYSVPVSSCDNGLTATYYGRAYFTTNTTYHDTTHHKWHVC